MKTYKGTLTLSQAKTIVATAGFSVADAACWENPEWVYAFSVQSHGSKAYGHARFTVAYNKSTGWVTEG